MRAVSASSRLPPNLGCASPVFSSSCTHSPCPPHPHAPITHSTPLPAHRTDYPPTYLRPPTPTLHYVCMLSCPLGVSTPCISQKAQADALQLEMKLQDRDRQLEMKRKSDLAEAGYSSPDYRTRGGRCSSRSLRAIAHEILLLTLVISDHDRHERYRSQTTGVRGRGPLLGRASSVDSDTSDDDDLCDGGFY